MSQLRWYQRAWFTRSAGYGFAVLVIAKAVHSVFFKQNDFDLHLHWGRLALEGAWDAVPFQYPPGRILFNEALAVLPRLVARALGFGCAIGSLVLTYRIWRDLAAKMTPPAPGVDLAAAALAFALLAPWVVRDFDECGLQILLLFFLSMVAWSLDRGARLQTGAWLGVAITFKFTPVLFVALLLWKRRWLEAGAAIGFVVVLNALAPALVWGPELARTALVRHVQTLRMAATLEDPSENGVERPSHRSQSLKLAIARFLQTYPPGHPLFIDRLYDDDGCTVRGVPPEACKQHPLFVQFLDLAPATARRVALAVMVAIGLSIAWRMRRPWRLGQAAATGPPTVWSALAPEWAVACAFAAVLSPLTWHQHLALMLPCGYLVIRDLLLRPARSRPREALLAVVFACVWILQRDPLSKQLSLIVMSYHEDVAAVLILVAMTLTVRGAIAPAQGDCAADPHSAGVPRPAAS